MTLENQSKAVASLNNMGDEPFGLGHTHSKKRVPILECAWLATALDSAVLSHQSFFCFPKHP
jgi:hypothetical protein